jgi:hypothetical protein
MSNTLSPAQLDALRRFDTCTVANAIETFNVRLRDVGFADSSVRCVFPKLPPLVGYAATVRIRYAGPPVDGRVRLGLEGCLAARATSPLRLCLGGSRRARRSLGRQGGAKRLPKPPRRGEDRLEKLRVLVHNRQQRRAVGPQLALPASLGLPLGLPLVRCSDEPAAHANSSWASGQTTALGGRRDSRATEHHQATAT